MRVIDFHVHVGTRHHWNPWVMDFFAENNPAYTRDFSEQITTPGVLDFLDQEGIARAVVLAEYAPKTTGVVTNEFLEAFCDGSDRLIPFGAICLYDGTDTGMQTERCVKEFGCRGLKMLPTYAHHYPDDPRLMAAYEVAQDLGIPVMFHTGTSIFKGSRIRFGNPLLLDDVAEDFPRLTIIMSHGGRPFWFTEAEWMLRRHPNVHIDVAGIPPKRLPSAFPHLEKYRDRFVFGTDWPGIPWPSRQVVGIEQLPFDSGIIEAILWGNAERILDLAT